MVNDETAITGATGSDLTVEAPEEPRRYYIDESWFEAHNLSFKVVAQARFCSSCKAKIGTESQERLPTVDERTGRVVFEMRSVPFGANPASVIRGCCAIKRDYITWETPVAEALFRVFLANGNQPSDVVTIREQISEWVTTAARPSAYNDETLEAILRGENQYGLKEFSLKVG